MAVMELNGKRFTSGNYARKGLSHGPGRPIRVEGKVLRHLRVYYAQERPFIIPEEQNLVTGVAAALSAWLEGQQAEEALRESEQRYRKLFEANLAGVYLTKPDGTILDFNDAMMRMLGYDSREELFQHRSTEFFADPEFRDELLRLLRKDGIVPAKEAVLRRKDGSVLYALGRGFCWRTSRRGSPISRAWHSTSPSASRPRRRCGRARRQCGWRWMQRVRTWALTTRPSRLDTESCNATAACADRRHAGSDVPASPSSSRFTPAVTERPRRSRRSICAELLAGPLRARIRVRPSRRQRWVGQGSAAATARRRRRRPDRSRPRRASTSPSASRQRRHYAN